MLSPPLANVTAAICHMLGPSLVGGDLPAGTLVVMAMVLQCRPGHTQAEEHWEHAEVGNE